MTVLGRLIALYPSLILSLAAATLVWFVYHPTLLQPLLFLVILYVIPPLTLRLRRRSSRCASAYYASLGSDICSLVGYASNPGAVAIPQLEAVLRLVPRALHVATPVGKLGGDTGCIGPRTSEITNAA